MQQFAWLKWRVVMVTTTITTTTTTPALREASSCLPWKCDVTIHPSDVTIRSSVTSYFAPLWCHTSPRCDVKIWPAVTSHSPSVTSYFALCDVTLRPAVTLYFFYTVYHVAESVDAILKSRWTDRNYKKKGLRSLKEKIYSMAPPCRLCLPLYSWHNDFVLGFNLA